MKTQWTLLMIAGLVPMAPALALAQTGSPRPMVVGNLSGNMHAFQSLPSPCPPLEHDAPVIGGRFEMAPAEGFDIGGGFRRFVLTRGAIRIQPFTLSVSCLGHNETRTYSAVSVQVASAVSFVGAPAGGDRFTFQIPPADVLIHEAATMNGRPEVRNGHPRDPVVGTIDLAKGTVQMTIVVATRIHVEGLGNFDGALTTAVSGEITFPDTDGDGVPDRSDNCRFVANPGQDPVTSPLLRAPVDLTLPSCQERRLGAATAFDICAGGRVTVGNDAPHPFPLGSTLVTWTATDSSGHVTTDSQTITIDDKRPPVFTSVPRSILRLDCGPADLGLPTATDDCGGSPTFTNDAPSSFPGGDTVVTWTATDLSGNHATATQTVTVRDTVPPEVSCVPGTNPAGRGNGNGGFFQVSASDHCDIQTVRLGSYVLGLGETIKITETGQPGVRLVNVMGPEHLRHFQVGRGQAVITATDGSNNVASATCR